MSTALLLDPTAERCPAWCQYPEGHSYEGTDHEETTEFRYHSRPVGRVDLDDGATILVDVCAEDARQIQQPERVAVATPSVALYVDTVPIGLTPEVTADQAQRLADLLHTAAVELDRINGRAA